MSSFTVLYVLTRLIDTCMMCMGDTEKVSNLGVVWLSAPINRITLCRV